MHTESKYTGQCKTFTAAIRPDTLMIVVPSLNPDEKLMQVVDSMIEEGFSHILIVDDGSDDAHKQPFKDAEKRAECTVLRHDSNRGKGAALKTAFHYIAGNRRDIAGVVTVDGDNQHKARDAMRLACALAEQPDAVILGVRDFSQRHVPFKSRMGNTLTSAVFRMLCGIALSDTQTGLRAISAAYFDRFSELEGERFEYETNMLLYMKETGIPFQEVPIETVYIENNATSHFNPLTDSAKIYRPIVRFAGGSLAAAAIDVTLFALMVRLLDGTYGLDREILIATAVARLISSLFNYTFNRKAVFASDEPKRVTLFRYYALCLVQMLLSYKGVALLVGAGGFAGFGKTAAKLLVDSVLFVLTFQIQREWVFQKKKTDRYIENGEQK
jgi:glycosyltransferase involved in cell wall biosynthesis